MEQLWNRMKNENSKWYERFEQFRMLGPDRTLLGILNQMVVQPGEKRRTSIPASWSNAFVKFNWKARAEAWDDAERHKNRQANEKARQKARKARVSLILAGIGKCREALDVIDPASAKFGEVMTGIKTLSEQARIEFGDAPTVSEITFNILKGVATGEMSVREAALRYNQEGFALPKAVEIMLSKEPPAEPEEETGHFPTDEELEARYQKAMAATDLEVSQFLPERRTEVEELKAELSDSDQWTDA